MSADDEAGGRSLEMPPPHDGPRHQALFTDFYELTMMAGYVDAGLADEPAVFDLFFRRPPDGVTTLLSAGQPLALALLERLAFTPGDLAYLRTTPLPRPFVDSLADLRFTGDVWAVPEGTPVFADEPVLRVEAPLQQAQLVETALLNAICYSTLVASNALEVRRAAGESSVLEFGARRAHGPDGALTASRAAFVGGCDATSNVQAGAVHGVPVAGTQAHSWVMSFDSELESFRAYAATYPDACVLLVDTYDTIGVGVPNAITVAYELAERGHALAGIRIDSGDLAAQAARARTMLDDAGLPDVAIVVSGDLDAPRIAALKAIGAPIDSFGVGTALVTAAQDPTISGVYKLAVLGPHGVAKRSSTAAKTTSPGRKQVWRTSEGDVIALNEEVREGTPLLQHVMAAGRRLVAPDAPVEVRARILEGLRASGGHGPWGREWPVRRSASLQTARDRVLTDLADGRREG